MMEEKLAQLIRLRDMAEEMVDNIESEYRNAFHEYAENVSKADNLGQMQADLHEKEERLHEAEYLMREIRSSVEVCQYAIQEIESETSAFSNESSHIIDNGRIFLQKSASDLRNYVELSNKK